MISLSSIHFPLSGWNELERDPSSVTWENGENGDGDLLMLNVFHVPPDLPPLEDLARLRDKYRDMLGRDGGIISLDVTTLARLPVVRTIFKFAIPDRPTGRSYLGALTFPFREASLVVRAQCVETGVTGYRESAVMMLLMERGETFPAEEGAGVMRDWASDPYRPQPPSPFLRNRADAEEWDTRFPEHPLSRVRRCLNDLESITFADEVYREPAFEGPP